MLDSKRGHVNLENLLVIKEFPDVFPEEFPGLPLEREVDMSIEVIMKDVDVLKIAFRT